MMMRLAPLLLAAVACATGSQANGTSGAPNAVAASPAGTVVVANMGDNTATLIDVATKRVVATLPTGNGAHEVAVSHDGRWAVVSNYGVRGAPGNTLTVIDVAAAVVTRTIDLGEFRRPHSSMPRLPPTDSSIITTSGGYMSASSNAPSRSAATRTSTPSCRKNVISGRATPRSGATTNASTCAGKVTALLWVVLSSGIIGKSATLAPVHRNRDARRCHLAPLP